MSSKSSEQSIKDIDFLLLQVKGSILEIKNIISEIASLNIGDDFIFFAPQVSELSMKHKKYPGYRITLQGELGQIKQKVSIDIGVGDVVKPKSLELELLFDKNVYINAYPVEYIFSEKLEAILYHGDLGSRMKDYYDCFRMIEEEVLDLKLLKDALIQTTSNRGTELRLIPKNTEPFSSFWSNFLRSNELDGLSMDEVISKINAVLEKII